MGVRQNGELVKLFRLIKLGLASMRRIGHLERENRQERQC
jgi:hypothetical protein